jgi:hypothetical protein
LQQVLLFLKDLLSENFMFTMGRGLNDFVCETPLRARTKGILGYPGASKFGDFGQRPGVSSFQALN